MLRKLLVREKYKSHLPVLYECALRTSPKTVIEFGSGKYSTLSLLDEELFPTVEQVASVEHDMVWIKKLSDRIGRTDRHRFISVADLDELALVPFPSAIADMVFVDAGEDDGSYKIRRKLLKRLEDYDPPLLVVHDTEESGLTGAIDEAAFKYKIRVPDRSGTETTVMSNSIDVSQWEFDNTVLDPDYKVGVYMCTRDGDPEIHAFMSATAETGMVHELHVERAPFSIAYARNQCVKKFLESDQDAMLFVDDTVVLPEGAIEELYNTPGDIVSGVVPSVCDKMGFIMPMANVMRPNMSGFYLTWPPEETFEISRCGMACCLIRRYVIEDMKFPYFMWPEDHYEDHKHMGEDIHFCKRSAEAGRRMVCNGKVKCEHKKTIDLGHMLPLNGQVPQKKTWKGPYVAHQPIHGFEGVVPESCPG